MSDAAGGDDLEFYSPLAIDHFTRPRNVGEMTDADGFASVGDPDCGDEMRLWLKIEDRRITDIRFLSTGCPGAIATSSMATELARGLTLEEALDLTDDDVVEALGGLPERKHHCSLMGIQAIHLAISDYMMKSIGA